jgi:hypothetical protein
MYCSTLTREGNYDFIINIVQNTSYPVNYVGQNGNRLIDMVAKLYQKSLVKIDLINQLRFLGSIEPKNLIVDSYNQLRKIVNINHENPEFQGEENSDNIRATKDLVKHFEKRFGHFDYDECIQSFMSSFNFPSNQELPVAWGAAEVNNVLEVIKKIKTLYSEDRHNQNDNRPWNFPQLFAYCIKIVCDKDGVDLPLKQQKDFSLYENVSSLVYFIAQLTKCELGKFVGLAYFAQNAYMPNTILDTDDLYSQTFQLICNTFNKESTSIALTKWFNERTLGIKPEDMSYESTLINGKFSEAAYKLNHSISSNFFNEIDKSRQDLFEGITNQEKIADVHKAYYNTILAGSHIVLGDVINELLDIKLDAYADIESALENIQNRTPVIYLKNYFNKKESYNSLSKAPLSKNALALIYQSTLGSEESINREMTKLLADRLEVGEDRLDYGKLPALIVANLIKYSNSKQLIQNLANEWTDWLNMDSEHHTILWHLGHDFNSNYREIAESIYAQHSQEWDSKIEHGVYISGALSEKWGDFL